MSKRKIIITILRFLKQIKTAPPPFCKNSVLSSVYRPAFPFIASKKSKIPYPMRTGIVCFMTNCANEFTAAGGVSISKAFWRAPAQDLKFV